MKNTHKLTDYDGKGDPDEHVQLIEEQLGYFSANDATSGFFFLR